MKRFTIFLKYVRPENGKIKNTVSYIIKNEQEMLERLSMHDGNVKKTQITYLK